MTASPRPESPSASLEDSVSQLAELLFAIFEGCNVDARLLIGRLTQLADAGGVVSRPSSLWASADLHLACTQVVFLWRRDRCFLDRDGNPMVLVLNGHEASFTRLCELAAPDKPADKLLEYLGSLGSVRLLEGGKVQLLTESVLACATQPERTVAPETVLMHLQGFLGAVGFNLLRSEGDPPARFDRACYGEIPTRLIPVFQRLVATRGQNFIDSIDEWLDRHRSDAAGGGEATRVGAGAYMLMNYSNKIER